MSLRMTFFACMAFAALALLAAAAGSGPAGAPAEPEGSSIPRFKWTVRQKDAGPTFRARPAGASLGAAAVDSIVRGDSLPRRATGLARARRAHRSARLFCARPAALRLVRYEDGSARLMCGERVLARIAVPG